MINKFFVKAVVNRTLKPHEVKLIEFINGLKASHSQALEDLLSAAEAKGFRDGRNFERSEKNEKQVETEKTELDEIKVVCTMIPKFIQTVENDLGEDEHVIEGDPLTYNEFERIQHFAAKLNNCINFVDVTIFE